MCVCVRVTVVCERASVGDSPTASTQSIPDCTSARASISADDPEEQLLLTLKTGTPVSPSSYTARCPHVGSP